MRRRVLAVLALGLLLAPLAGCSKRIGAIKDPVPPDTRIFVEGPVDTVNHVVHLYWFGTDPDGYIRGFEYRFYTSPEESVATPWTFTRETDRVFSVLDSTGYTAPTFQVRAVDSTMVPPPADAAPDAPGGLRDPSPARQDFKFSNHPPVVRLSGYVVTDTTFASATVTWTVSDPDNDLAGARFRIWLDGRQNTPDIVAGRSFTVPTARFYEIGTDSTLVSRPRQLFIQAIDDGGMAGNVDSTRWYVSAPATGGRHHQGRLLIIDDLPARNNRNTATDSLFANTAQRTLLLRSSYSIVRLEPSARWNQSFRSAKDVEQTFKLFDAVVWYYGGSANWDVTPSYIERFQDGIGAYLDAGGNFFVTGLNLLDANNAPGALTEDFAREYLGTEGYVQRWTTLPQSWGAYPDSTAAWALSGGGVDVVFPSLDDSLILSPTPVSDPKSALPGSRAFILRDAGDGLVVAPPGAVSGNPPFPLVIGVSVSQASRGRAIALSFPISLSPPVPPSAMDPRTSRVLAKIFGLLGLTAP